MGLALLVLALATEGVQGSKGQLIHEHPQLPLDILGDLLVELVSGVDMVGDPPPPAV